MVDKKEFEKVLKELPDYKRVIADTILDDLIFIENNLIGLRQYLEKNGSVKHHPKYPEISKPLPEARQYKDFLTQKNNLIRTLNNTLRNNLDGEEDKNPLEEFNKLFAEKFGSK